MSESNHDSTFIGYEYTDVTVDHRMEAVYADGYENFGWSLEDVTGSINNSYGAVTMKFKRDRKVRNKAELTRLARQFDACVAEILTMENSKGFKASAVAYAIGILGSALLAGAVFACLSHMIPLMLVLAVPGFAGWVAPYFCYRRLKRDKTQELNPMIENKYDEIYEICQKANALLV